MLSKHCIRLSKKPLLAYKSKTLSQKSIFASRRSINPLAAPSRHFSNKFSVTQWILDYEARMKQASNIESSETSGSQFTNGVLFAVLSASFLLIAICNEVYQYWRFRKIMKSYFFKTGLVEVSNHKAKPSPEDFPIYKLYPQRILIQLVVNKVKENTKSRRKDEMWERSASLSQVFAPKIDIEQFADVTSDDEKIKFDFTNIIEPKTLIDLTTPPIIVGKTAEPTVQEIQIIKDKFADWSLFYFDQQEGFFYFTKNPTEEEKAILDIKNEENYKKHKFANDDIRVKVKIWDSDDYTIFGRTENQIIKPFKFKMSKPLLYITKNRDIYIEDIKLKYDTEWVFYRVGLVFVSALCYAVNQFSLWGASFSNYVGFLPVATGLGLMLYWFNLQVEFFDRSVKRLDAIDMKNPRFKNTFFETIS